MNRKQYLEIINFLRNKENDLNTDLEILRLISQLLILEEVLKWN